MSERSWVAIFSSRRPHLGLELLNRQGAWPRIRQYWAAPQRKMAIFGFGDSGRNKAFCKSLAKIFAVAVATVTKVLRLSLFSLDVKEGVWGNQKCKESGTET